MERKAHNEQLRPLTKAKCKSIEDNIRCGPRVPDEVKKQCLDLVMKHHAVVSKRRFDLRQTTAVEHEIHLKDLSSVYVKQFQIPDAHREEVEKHVNKWLKNGGH